MCKRFINFFSDIKKFICVCVCVLENMIKSYHRMSKFQFRRCLATLAQETEWDKAKPYDTIPGPKSLRQLRDFFPGGKLYDKPLKFLHAEIQKQYGDIVLVKGMLRRPDMVLIYDPADFEMLHRTEGQWPARNIFETLMYYRKHVRPDIYGETGGLLTEHGKKWSDFRTAVNPVMLQPKVIKYYLDGIDQIAMEFADKIRRDRNENLEVGDSFLLDITTWALESIAFIALDTRLNVISSNDTSSDGHKIVKYARDFFNLSYKLEALPSIWKYVKTRNFVKQMATLDNLTFYTKKYIDEATKKIDENSSANSVLQKLIKIDKSTAFVMASDMLLAGADTTGSLTTSILYELAINPDKQQILRESILPLLPNKNDRLKQGDLTNIPYMRAVIKEAARLHAVVGANMRAAGQDLLIKGYHIPKGTDVGTINMNLYMNEKYFPSPEKFMPERWLRSDSNADTPLQRPTNPFVYLPFGFGIRSCIGRRFAELEMECFFIRLVRNFEITWNLKSELKMKNDFVNSPIAPIRFGFKDIEY